MAYPDLTWPCDGNLSISSAHTEEEQQQVTWNIFCFLKNSIYGRSHAIKSVDFPFAGAVWNFFFSFDREENHCLFGISVRTRSSSDPDFDCRCDISFLHFSTGLVKNIKCNIKLEGSGLRWAVTDFLSHSDLKNFLENGTEIVCKIDTRKSRIKEACSQTEITLFTRSSTVEAHIQTQLPESVTRSSTVEAHTQTQLPEKAEEYSMVSLGSKVLEDFKNLLLTGEGADVILQVQDQQFKAHRSVLTARSTVFAAMLRHDTKEKATGVVDVADCELSSFPVFLEYLYCGSTDKFSPDNVFSLYVSADKYDLQDLKGKCLEFMKSHLSLDTICETVWISLQHSEGDLLKLATEFFTRNFHQIIVTAKWQTFLSENPIQGNELIIKAAKTFR